MRTITWAAIVAMVMCGTSLGASNITYTLGLGGDNDSNCYEGDGPPCCGDEPLPPCPELGGEWYPPFDTTDAVYSENPPATFDRATVGRDLTWHVEITASGDDPTATETNGAANMVFTLELYVGTDTSSETGVLAAAADYHSTINDGDRDGARGARREEDDELHNAAFCFVYDIGDNGVTDNPGMVISNLANGGPYCNRKQYPSKNGPGDNTEIPLAVAVQAGVLMGMGCGYSEYSGPGGNRGGIGMDTTGGGRPGLGAGKPVFEGQVDTCALPQGTYTLVLIATNAEGENVGSNILDGNFDTELGEPGAFAWRADTVTEDAITFAVINECPAICSKPVAQSAESVKTHSGGPNPAYEGKISIMNSDNTEPRAGGPTLVVITYDLDIQPADGTLDTEVSLSDGSLDDLSIAGKQLIIELSDVTDGAVLEITVSGIADAAAGIPAPGSCVEGDPVYKVCVLLGDTNNNGQVTGTDLSTVKSQLFTTVGDINFRSDFDAGNVLGGTDLSTAKARLFETNCSPWP